MRYGCRLFLSLLPLIVVSAFVSSAFAVSPVPNSPSFQAEVLSLGSGLCLGPPGVAATSGLALPQSPCAAPGQQTFSFVVQPDGTFAVHSPASMNLCVDLSDSGAVVQNYCLPTASQKWANTLNQDGSYTLLNQQNNQCLVVGPAAALGASSLSTALCNGTTAQEFGYALAQPFAPPTAKPVLRAPPSVIANPTVGQWQAGMFNGLPYRILFPSGYDPSQYAYPISLFLHGAGESGTDNRTQLRNDIWALASDMDFRAKVPMILVAPQCPSSDNWGDPYSATPSVTEALAVKLMQELVASLPVDATRVSVTGLSMGGFGAWDMIVRYPALFAAAAPLAAAGNLSAAGSLVKVPLLAVHGGADLVVLPIFDELMYNLIHQQNGAMVYFELSGVGHDVWDYVYPLTLFWQLISTQKHI